MSHPAGRQTVDGEILDARSFLMLDALKLRLANQLAPRSWRGSFERLAQRLERGQPLDEAFAAEQTRLPSELECLIREAIHVRDPAKLILDVVRVRDEIGKSWRELLVLLAYPMLLIGIAMSVGVAFSFVMQNIMDFGWIEEFGMAGYEQVVSGLNDQHHAIVGLGMVFLWLLMVMATVAVIGPRWAWAAVAGGMVLVGRPVRWISLQEILRRLEMFVAQGMPPVEATEAVSRSFARSRQAIAADAIAQRAKSGMSLGRSLSASMLSDGLCRPALLLLDERGSDMQCGLLDTSTLIGRLVEQRCRTLATVLPVFALVLVGTIVWASICTYLMGFMPLITMINALV